MSTKVIVNNVPAGTTPGELRAHWEKTGAPILSIEPVEGGDADNLAFTVEIDIAPKTAKLMVDRHSGSWFKGRQLRVFAPTPHD